MVQPFVSILIPCYNAERWIAEAIESALAQTWPAKEVIVVDDGSTDRSPDIVKSFGDRIHSEAGKHQGGNQTRNRLLELAHGEWVQYLDADDYLLPDKVAHQMEFRVAHPDANIIFGPVFLEHWSEQEVQRELVPIPEPHDIWVLLASWRLPQTGASLWRKKALIDVGGWNGDQPCCQEHELYLRLIIGGHQFAYCPAGGAIYRQWSDATVCRRDISEVHRCRLAIEQAAEDHLRSTQQLTMKRLGAISQARFEIARSAWKYDSAFARRILQKARETDPNFRPAGPAAPLPYRMAFRWFGFEAAETLAAKKRKVAGRWLRMLPQERQAV